jgi:hypothetical protein
MIAAVAAAGLGFGASYLFDSRTMNTLKAERDAALDCRHAGETVAPCPVQYRNTRIVWQDRIRTVQAPDRRQAERIAKLSAQLERARLTIHKLEFIRIARARRATGAYFVQNGSMEHPYNTYEKCPPGSVAVYDAALAFGGNGGRRSGDPNVCYVRTRLHNVRRLALSLPRS